jgi:hypothetical protein
MTSEQPQNHPDGLFKIGVTTAKAPSRPEALAPVFDGVG